jgi:hypothetical protein
MSQQETLGREPDHKGSRARGSSIACGEAHPLSFGHVLFHHPPEYMNTCRGLASAGVESYTDCMLGGNHHTSALIQTRLNR